MSITVAIAIAVAVDVVGVIGVDVVAIAFDHCSADCNNHSLYDVFDVTLSHAVGPAFDHFCCRSLPKQDVLLAEMLHAEIQHACVFVWKCQRTQ